MLKVENIHKYYPMGRGRLHVLKGISFEVEEGEFLAIRGPSGAGKSTLLHVIGGLERPDEGRIIFEGEDIYSLDDAGLSRLRNERIGFVFQFYHLIPELNLLENVCLPLLIKRWDRKGASRKAREVLDFLKLEDRLSHYPNQLSGGEQQRAAIARAMITEPKILLCDEPTGNLDSQMGEEVLKLLKKINEEKRTTILVVTHDEEVASWAQRVLYIRNGELVK